jgi:hypothetical protein
MKPCAAVVTAMVPDGTVRRVETIGVPSRFG